MSKVLRLIPQIFLLNSINRLIYNFTSQLYFFICDVKGRSYSKTIGVWKEPKTYYTFAKAIFNHFRDFLFVCEFKGKHESLASNFFDFRWSNQLFEKSPFFFDFPNAGSFSSRVCSWDGLELLLVAIVCFQNQAFSMYKIKVYSRCVSAYKMDRSSQR